MTTVKFDKSVKYKGVRYAAHQSFKVEDSDVAQLKKDGATVLAVDEPVNPPVDEQATVDELDDEQATVEDSDKEEKNDEDVAQLKEKLLDYTIPELVAFAHERSIDIQGKTRKADIYNIIVSAL